MRSPSPIEKDPASDGIRVATYERPLNGQPSIAEGDQGTTLQARYVVLPDHRCAFTTRSHLTFPGGRPPEYKGVVGPHKVIFRPMGIADWQSGAFRAVGYFWLLPVMLWGGAAALILVIAGATAVVNPTSGSFMAGVLMGVGSALFVGWNWRQDRRLFITLAEEVAAALEATAQRGGGERSNERMQQTRH
jgi:hypothetical protein